MGTSYTLPCSSVGRLYVKAGKVIAFIGDPELYDGDFFRKSVTISTNAIIRAHIVETNYKGDVNITYNLNYDLSPYSGTWSLANQSVPPLISNWYGTAGIPSVPCTLTDISVVPTHGTLDYGTPFLNGGTFSHDITNKLYIDGTNLGRWYIPLGLSYDLAVRMFYKNSDDQWGDDYSRHCGPVNISVTKANSLAAGHSVLGAYSISVTPSPFALLSGSWTVSA